MPTLLEHGKSVTRETQAHYQGRPLIAQLHSSFLRLRQKKRKDYVDVDLRVILELGYKLRWKEAKKEKDAAKKAKAKRKGDR